MSERKSVLDIFGFMSGNILVLTLTNSISWFFNSMVMPYVSLYILALGGEPTQIGLINSLGNLGGFLAPNMRDYFDKSVGGNAGLYSLAVAAVIGAALFALTAVFKKANEIEAGHLDEVDAAADIRGH